MAQQVEHLLPSLATEFDPRLYSVEGKSGPAQVVCPLASLCRHALEDEAFSLSSVSHEALLEGLGTSDSDTQVELYNVL